MGSSHIRAWFRSSSFSSASFWLVSSILSTTCFSFFTSSWSFWLFIWRSVTQYTSSDVSLGKHTRIQSRIQHGFLGWRTCVGVKIKKKSCFFIQMCRQSFYITYNSALDTSPPKASQLPEVILSSMDLLAWRQKQEFGKSRSHWKYRYHNDKIQTYQKCCLWTSLILVRFPQQSLPWTRNNIHVHTVHKIWYFCFFLNI